MAIAHLTKRAHNRSRGSETRSRGSVQVRGENIFYEASGLAELGPTILFLHESGGSAATWQEQLTGLAPTARCLVPDLPGHGRSEGTGRPTIAEYSETILGFLDALAIRWPVVVAGVCLGAAIATEMAVTAPTRVSALVLGGLADGGRACEKTMEAVGRGEAHERFIQGLFSDGASARLVNDRFQRWLKTNPAVRYADLQAVRAHPFSATLRLVRQPTLLVAGEADTLASPAHMFELAGCMLSARSTAIAQAGCLAMQERPAFFNRVLADFLGQLGQSGPMEPDFPVRGGYRRY